MRKPRRLDDAFRFPGFRPEATVRGIFGDPKARILRLLRRGKKRPAGRVGGDRELSTTARPVSVPQVLFCSLPSKWYDTLMKTVNTAPALDRLVGALGECLTPESA